MERVGGKRVSDMKIHSLRYLTCGSVIIVGLFSIRPISSLSLSLVIFFFYKLFIYFSYKLVEINWVLLVCSGGFHMKVPWCVGVCFAQTW